MESVKEKEALLFNVIESNKSFSAEEVIEIYNFIIQLRHEAQK